MRATGEEPQHDTQFQFSIVQHPQRLQPGWEPPQRLARLPWPGPEDLVGRLLWLVGPGSEAGPWMPSPQQQDEAWLAVWSDHYEKLRANRQYYAALSNGFDGRQR